MNVKNLTKSYGENIVLKNIDLNIPCGKIVSFLGKNGAGKSTTIKIIIGLLTCDTGVVTINGFNIKENSVEYKTSFGYVPDDYNIFPNLTGFEYLNFLADMYKINNLDRTKRIRYLSKILDMEKYLNSRIGSYSKGMKQKIMIIGALMHNPKVLILDEPFNGLDPESIYVVKSLFHDIVKDNRTIFFSTHILDMAENLSDIVIILDEGKIVFNSEINTIKLSNKSLEDVFLEKTKKY